MSPKRIAYLVSQFPETFETFILREVVEMVSRGIDAQVFSLKPCRDRVVHPEAAALAPRTHYRSFILSPEVVGSVLLAALTRPIRFARAVRTALTADFAWRHPIQGGIRTLKNLAVFPKACSFARAIRRGHFDHVHAHWANTPATAAMVVSELADVPMSFTAHAFDIYKGQPELRQKIAKARFVVTCTEFNRRFLEELDPGQQTKIHLNYHGLDPSRFEPSSASEPGPIRLLAIGRLVDTKGFEYLLEACSILHRRGIPLHCTIVGDGPLRRRLTALAAGVGVEARVALPGVMSQEQLQVCFQKADLFVMPSVVTEDGDRDGIPNVVLEAMAMGLPIIGSRISGLPEVIVDGENGHLVSERSAVAIADAIGQLHDQPATRRAMGEASRRRVMERFVLERNVKELIEIFEEEWVA